MAAIDKIYETLAQHDELVVWLTAHHARLLKYVYPRRDEADIPAERERALTNFPSDADRWLLVHCPIEWVKEAICDQYAIGDRQWKKEAKG